MNEKNLRTREINISSVYARFSARLGASSIAIVVLSSKCLSGSAITARFSFMEFISFNTYYGDALETSFSKILNPEFIFAKGHEFSIPRLI